MNSKKLGRRLRNISIRSVDTEGDIIDDLFGGLDLNGNGSETESTTGGSDGRRKTKAKKTKITDLPDTLLEDIFEYLPQGDLVSLRLVNKQISKAATEIFREVHTPVVFKTDNDIFRFRHEMDTSALFPFSRFHLILQHVARHVLIKFTQTYEVHIEYLKIEAFDIKGDGGHQQMIVPSQRPVMKLTGVIQELKTVEDLDIIFPTLSDFDYHCLEFEKDYELKSLKIFSVGFSTNGFSQFSSDLTINILHHAENLQKLRLKLPEPSNPQNESDELQRVLEEAVNVPTIGIFLNVNTNRNILLKTIREAIEGGYPIRSLTLSLGQWCNEYKWIVSMLNAASCVCTNLVLYRKLRKDWVSKPINQARLIMPYMRSLQHLRIDSYLIPLAPIQAGRFPNLISLELHLKYGDDEFYRNSVLHPLEKLKLHFHETAIMKVVPPERIMDRLISKDLKKMELVNPPPGHLTFMCCWGGQIETLILSASNAYGEDPTYPTERLLAQLCGMMQLREGYYNHLGLLDNLQKLKLLLPIDERMAEYLAYLPRLWELVVDDQKVSDQSIRLMKSQHHIYISWRPLI